MAGVSGRFALKVIDKGMAKLRKELERARAFGSYCKVGIMDGDGSGRMDGNATNLEVGIYNEFGTATIPERSFIRATVAAERPKYIAMLKKLMPAVYEGKMTLERALGLVGATAAADIKRRMAQGIPPPNAPATIAKKGSSKPLIDTGQLKNSITWAVVIQGSDRGKG